MEDFEEELIEHADSSPDTLPDRVRAVIQVGAIIVGKLNRGSKRRDLANLLFRYLMTAVERNEDISTPLTRGSAASLIGSDKGSATFTDAIRAITNAQRECRPSHPELLPDGYDRDGAAVLDVVIDGAPHLVLVRGPLAEHRGDTDDQLRLRIEFRRIQESRPRFVPPLTETGLQPSPWSSRIEEPVSRGGSRGAPEVTASAAAPTLPDTVTLHQNEAPKLQLIADTVVRYLVTTIDLLIKKRPRNFMEALRVDTSRYLAPLSYLSVSVAFTIALGCSLALLLAPMQEIPALQQAGLITGAWLILIVIVVALICTFGPAALVARLLRIHVTPRDVLVAGCYSSVLLPVVLATAEIDYYTNRDQPTATTVILCVTATLSYEFFAVSLLARSIGLSGWRSKLYISMAVIAIIVLNGTAALLLRGRQTPPSVSAMVSTADTARVHTADAEITSNGARVFGSSTFLPTEEWFEFDDRPQMRERIKAVEGLGVASALRPNTTYYYRYVAKNHDLTFYGEVGTFTTPPE